ncbi:unnamed protein product, partial [Mesorhabditis belari]|uniref:Uncharacterized protein n=1 Tax=Mesorhabditis belari TaxID=2138241 RepID=A0AAF3J680_9BILA
MKKEFVFLLVASLAQIVTANDEWMEECKNQSANIQIHSADGNWKNFSSDETSNKYFWIDRTFTCTADPDHFALVRINHKMDFPSDTKTITCGSRRKWVYKDEVVLNVGCYTGTRADWIQESEEEERIRKWMAENHGVKENQKDWTWGSTQYDQQKKMQRMASEIQNLLINTDNIIRKQVAVLPADYANAYREGKNYVIFVFRGGFPERSKPDAREGFSRYFQAPFQWRDRHDGIQSLAERAATYGPIEEWRKECNNQSEKIVIHSADGNWTNLSSDLTTHQQYEVYRKFTCTADPGHFAFVQINDQMDSPSDTKSIGCGKERKWLHKGEVVVAVGCYTGPRENWIQKPEEEERIRNWMGEHHGAKEDQKDWTWGSTQYKQQEEMQRMASEIQKLLVNTDNIVRKQVAVLPADYKKESAVTFKMISIRQNDTTGSNC